MSIFIHTNNGRRLSLDNPSPADISMPEIASALGRICRYNGQVDFHYSVAEHCLLLSQAMELEGCEPIVALGALLHDAAEAYTGDISAPIAALLGRGPQTDRLRDLTAKLEVCIVELTGLPLTPPRTVGPPSITPQRQPTPAGQRLLGCIRGAEGVHLADLRILLHEREALLHPFDQDATDNRLRWGWGIDFEFPEVTPLPGPPSIVGLDAYGASAHWYHRYRKLLARVQSGAEAA